MLDLGEVPVELAAQLDKESIVGELQQQFHGRLWVRFDDGARQRSYRQGELPVSGDACPDLGKHRCIAQQIVVRVTKNS
jgi:hypothetical protein